MGDLVDRNAFCDTEGKTDWIAYRKAQIENGELCYQCGAFIYSFLHSRDNGSKRLCYECKELHNNDGECCSSKYIRCPYCRSLIDTDYAENYEIFEDGDHSVYCDSCDMKFEFVTSVYYSFESPPIKSKNT